MTKRICKYVLHENKKIECTYIYSESGSLYGIEIQSQDILTLPDELFTYQKILKSLDLSFNKLNDISFIRSFNNLEEINLSGNNIIDISPIEKLQKLRILYLCNNKIVNTESLVNLKNLAILNLTSNKIQDITSLVSIIDKTNVFLSHGGIKDGVYLHDNPIQTPPREIIDRGKHSVIQYIKEYIASEVYLNNELKLILIGNSAVGKTALAKYLELGVISESHSSTHGINDISIKRIGWHKNIEDINIRILDFGGQEYYHDTHHLFFTSDTAYCLIWTKNSNGFSCQNTPIRINGEVVILPLYNYPIKYWLDAVSYFGNVKNGYNKDIKLLSIQSKIDIEGVEMLNNSTLQKDNPFIYNFINCNLREKRDLLRIEEVLKEMISGMSIIGSTYIKSWWHVRKFIEESEKNEYTYAEFKDLVISKGGLGEEDQITLLANFLSDIGILIIYTENNEIIGLYKSSWLIKNIYQILDAKVKEMNGEFTKEHIRKIVKENEEQIISIMIRFKLIVKLPNSQTFATPLYFKDSPCNFTSEIIKNFKSDNSVICKFHTDGYIHKSIILEFFSEYAANIHSYCDNKICYSAWRNGVLLVSKGSESHYILVEFNDKTKDQYSTIEVSILDENKEEKLAGEIVSKIETLLRKSTKFISNTNGEFLEYTIVNTNFRNNINEFVHNDKKYLVNLFWGFRNKEKPINKNDMVKTIFISYAHEDAEYLQKVEKHLKVLKKEGFDINYFDDTKIKAGEKWDEEINKNLINTQIAVLLISNDFLISDYITETEMPAFIKAVKKNKAVILPLIIRPCRFEESKELKQFQAIHNPRQPLSKLSENDQEEVLLKLTERIAELIKTDNE